MRGFLFRIYITISWLVYVSPSQNYFWFWFYIEWSLVTVLNKTIYYVFLTSKKLLQYSINFNFRSRVAGDPNEYWSTSGTLSTWAFILFHLPTLEKSWLKSSNSIHPKFNHIPPTTCCREIMGPSPTRNFNWLGVEGQVLRSSLMKTSH